jgi:hypothetical protein
MRRIVRFITQLPVRPKLFRTVRRALAAIFACMPLAAPAAADAAPRPPDLWATVNICDTVRYPDRMGVRASMPGSGRRGSMYMRFQAQFFDGAANTWKDVGGTGVSHWIPVGSSRFRMRQAGYTFAFGAPTTGNAFVLRGRVEFEWRERRRLRSGELRTVVVRRARVNTKAGYASKVAADPAGYSASLCEIR